jgi:hypothetical protein
MASFPFRALTIHLHPVLYQGQPQFPQPPLDLHWKEALEVTIGHLQLLKRLVMVMAAMVIWLLLLQLLLLPLLLMVEADTGTTWLVTNLINIFES